MSVHATLPNPHSDPQNQPPELHGILESRVFEKSPALRRLLLYLWIIALKKSVSMRLQPKHWSGERTLILAPIPQSGYRSPVFDKSSRNNYDDEGKEEPSRITVPLGSYNLQLHLVSSENGVPSAEEAPSPS